jgi:hypothetical protein
MTTKRTALADEFMSVALAEFKQHGPALFAELRRTDPAQWCKLIAATLPKEVAIAAPPAGGLDALDLAALQAWKLEIPDIGKLSPTEVGELMREGARRVCGRALKLIEAQST